MQSIELTNERIQQKRRRGKPMQKHSDKALLRRIDRATGLMERGSVIQISDGHWVAKSASVPGKSYELTESACTCQDREPLCKHLWAGPGRNAALLISAMMTANNVVVLQFIVDAAASLLGDVPEPFTNIAWSIFRLRLEQLRSVSSPAASAQP